MEGSIKRTIEVPTAIFAELQIRLNFQSKSEWGLENQNENTKWQTLSRF